MAKASVPGTSPGLEEGVEVVLVEGVEEVGAVEAIDARLGGRLPPMLAKRLGAVSLRVVRPL